mmetsp:Transcript_34843/g.68797  ORF Transcript_34843/g.68797 Transcript_34843/m.68797 type:complete len:297 (-) Transcript_34843:11-901(-)
MAAALINDLHYSLLCKLALACNGHVNGLNTGIARNKRQLSNKLVKQLRSVETAYNLLRHVTVFSCKSLEQALDEALASESCAGTSNSTSVNVEAANSALWTSKDVMKKNQAAPAGVSTSEPHGDKSGEAAKSSDASYPVLHTALGRVIVTGAQADPKLYKAAADAGVTSKASQEAVVAATSMSGLSTTAPPFTQGAGGHSCKVIAGTERLKICRETLVCWLQLPAMCRVEAAYASQRAGSHRRTYLLAAAYTCWHDATFACDDDLEMATAPTPCSHCSGTGWKSRFTLCHACQDFE